MSNEMGILGPKIYEVTYEGSWFGGTAIVKAYTPEEAIELVRKDPRTTNFTRVDVEVIHSEVLYNWDGDY